MSEQPTKKQKSMKRRLDAITEQLYETKEKVYQQDRILFYLSQRVNAQNATITKLVREAKEDKQDDSE